MSLRVEVHTDFTDVCASMTNLLAKVIGGMDELIHHFPPPTS